MKTNRITLAAVAIFAIFAQTLFAQVPVPAPAGLIGWWPGDGNAKDLAGGNTGVLVNARTGSGYIGDAFVFPGENSYVLIPNSPGINSITNALTLEAWVWHDATGATIQRYVTLTSDRAVILYFAGPIKFELHFADGAIVPLTSCQLRRANGTMSPGLTMERSSVYTSTGCALALQLSIDRRGGCLEANCGSVRQGRQ